MSRVGRFSALALTGLCLMFSLVLPSAAVAAGTTSDPESEGDTASDLVAAGASYPGDPAAEALLVAAEDRRIVSVRAIANAADWTGASESRPYRLETGTSSTLVLVARATPYTIEDLLVLAPRTFSRNPDGEYLLSENIVVEQGATLNLSNPGGFTLRLESSATAFVSIITVGGSLTLSGTASKPATVTSWDPTTGKLDTDTSDGRSYIRVIGGRAELSFVAFDSLGFWSGATGGIALTGTDDIDLGSASDPTQLAIPEAATGQDVPTLATGDLDSFSYVSALIQDVTFTNNAFGLFVTSAEGVIVRDTTVKDSLVDGIVMHRFVSKSEIANTSSTGNAMDGFRLARATSGIVLTDVTATGNGANGISLNGQALADGPSATGTSVGSYGNNRVTQSTFSGNERYGVEVLGGEGLKIAGNTVDGNEMGIVVSKGATRVAITDNVVTDSEKQGIALRSADTDALIQGNTLTGGAIGIYARDSGGVFADNTVTEMTNHGITLIGKTGSSVIDNNTFSGSGPSAIDTERGALTTVTSNNIEDWTSTKPFAVIVRGIFQPLTVMWLLLGLLLLVTAVSSIGRSHNGFVHPYAHLAPLSSFTPGEVDRELITPTRSNANSLGSHS